MQGHNNKQNVNETSNTYPSQNDSCSDWFLHLLFTPSCELVSAQVTVGECVGDGSGYRLLTSFFNSVTPSLQINKNEIIINYK